MQSDSFSAFCTFFGFWAICLLGDPGGSSLLTGMIMWFLVMGFSVFVWLLTSGSGGWRGTGLSPKGLVLGGLAWIAFAGFDRVIHPPRVENVSVISSAEKQRSEDTVWLTVVKRDNGNSVDFYPGKGPKPEVGKTYPALVRSSWVGTRLDQLSLSGESLTPGTPAKELNGIAIYVCLIAVGAVFAAQKLQPILRGALLIKEMTLQPSDSAVVPTPAGFSLLGHFTSPQMKGLRLSAFWSEEHLLYAVAYEHPGRPNWWDVVSSYADGTTATTTAIKPSGLEQDPRHPNTYFPDSPLETLVAKHLESRPAGPCPTRTADEFEANFCRGYREAIQWRMAKGISREEIKRFADASGRQVSEEVLDMAHRDMESKLKES